MSSSVNHASLATRWQTLSLLEQLGNIGSEISRARRWEQKDQKLYQGAIERALELIDFTLADARWNNRLKEFTRLREILCRLYLKEDSFKSNLKNLEDYCTQFAIAARNSL